MVVTNSSFGVADLTNCDREPIEIPGSIQPHGILVVLHPESLVILQAAGPTDVLLGLTVDDLLGVEFGALVSADAVQVIRDILTRVSHGPRSENLFSFEVTAVGQRFDAAVHAGEAGMIVEMEPVKTAPPLPGGPLGLVQTMLASVQDAAGLKDFCQRAAEEVQRATGFARVMVYRFNEDDSGHVFAEARKGEIGTYLDLHFPASDIPAQARDLYSRNWLRLIADARYQPAPLIPSLNPLTGAPVNLSHCALRSVSPLHLEYLANMGVRASMSVSIMRGGKLWGLFACHHDQPRHLAPGLRAACELFAQMFSFQLEARIKADTLEEAMRMRGIHDRLVAVISSEPDIVNGLVQHQPNLQDYLPSSGVALWLDGRYSSIGTTPDEGEIKKLAEWLAAGKAPGVWATDRLPLVWEDGRDMAGQACGVLVLSVSRSPRDYIFWFRPEVLQTVTWAGNPNKPVETTPGELRLSPRRSFDAWVEQVRFRTVPWSEAEITAAQTLRTTLLEVVLQRVDQVARERELSRQRQELLLAELDHRVKNTLANIQALVQYASASGGSGGDAVSGTASEMLNGFTASFGHRLRAMAHAHSLLTQSRWEGADLRSLLEEEARAHTAGVEGAAVRTRLTGPEIMLRPKAALALSMAIHELVTNAAKYGALSVPDGMVDIAWALNEGGKNGEAATFTLDWTESGGPPVSPPTRHGFGRIVIEKSLAYEVDGESRLVFAAGGVRCHVRIPVEHVVDRVRPPQVSITAAGPRKEAEPVLPSRVLLVEDSGLVAMQIQNLLEEAGCEVVGPASRVGPALRLAMSEVIDAAVLDVDLNGTPSWDVADALTSRGIPFVLATGYSSDNALPDRFRSVPKLLKPFSTQGFEAALRKLLEAR